ncbi:MAG: hypothetical protein ACRYFS_17805 [Janthinobacterium lividum]
MATDTFTPGQWFHGRIFEKRCDLSPDGTLLIYFAQKIDGRTKWDEGTHNWTAISRLPYLTALALWMYGYGGGGGGLFSSNTDVRLNQSGQAAEPHPDHLPRGLNIDTRSFANEDAHLSQRLIRDGWQHTQKLQGEAIESPWGKAYWERKRTGLPTDFDWHRTVDHLSTTSRYIFLTPGIDEKPNSDRSLTLVMKTTTRNGYSRRYTYFVRDAEGLEEPLTGAEWADWDYRGRLVFARDGKIFALPPDGVGRAEPQELANLNDHKPEPMVAPDWAKVW